MKQGLLVIVAILAPREEAPVLNRLETSWLASLLVGGVGLIFLVLYLVWTPVGDSVVDGIHGRYFLPFTALLAALPEPRPRDFEAVVRRVRVGLLLERGLRLLRTNEPEALKKITEDALKQGITFMGYTNNNFIGAAHRLARARPGIRFVAPMANAAARALFEQALTAQGDLPIDVIDGQSSVALTAADCVLVASGTATLETLLCKRPMVVAYRLGRATAFIIRRLMRAPFFSQPNLLAGEALVPELFQEEVTPEALATGKTVQVGFELAGRFPDGWSKISGGAGEFVLPSGVVLTSFSSSFLPVAGFVDSVGVDDKNRRDAREYPLDHWKKRVDPAFGPAWSTTVRLAIEGPEHWILNGSKQWITSGNVAGVMVVWARTTKAASETDHKGITAFVVEGGSKGLIVNRAEEKMGLHGSYTAALTFEDLEVPAGQVLGSEGEGFKLAMVALNGGRIGIASQACGVGRAALEQSVRYAKERVAFGQPIAGFQAIQWMLADMKTQLEAARLLTLRAAFLKETGKPYIREASMAKLMASETAFKICDKAIQIHGGYGYTNEFPVERYWRDNKLCEIGEGTSEVQRMVIARNLLK